MTFKYSGARDIFDGKDTRAARQTLPLEALMGNRKGQHSIRINGQYRICFVWNEEEGPSDVEIVDYHR